MASTRRDFVKEAAGLLAAWSALPGADWESRHPALRAIHPARSSLPPLIEPYAWLHGGAPSGPSVPESPDPLVAYRWNHPQASDALQCYVLRPKAIFTTTPESFQNAASATTGICAIAVRGSGSIRFDFGVESPAWLEFDSPDCSGDIELSISEHNQPGIYNPGPEHPMKTATPVRYGSTYRLELNSELYEGVRFGWIHVRAFQTPWHITAVRAVCQVKPTNYTGAFACSDPLLTRIWYTGAYAVKTMFNRDHIASCLIMRGDRDPWSGSAIHVLPVSLVAFGNWDYLHTYLAAGGDQSHDIPPFDLYWILSLLYYYRYTGDSTLLHTLLGTITRKLDQAQARYADPTKLSFYGWDERLGAGFYDSDCLENKRAYRMLILRTYREFAAACEMLGQAAVGASYAAFADEQMRHLRADPHWFAPFGIHALADAVNAGVTTAAEQAAMFTAEFADRVSRLSFCPANIYFILQALARMGRYDEALLTARDCWGGMIAYGGTTFFETYRTCWNDFLGTNDPIPNCQSGVTELAQDWTNGVTAWLTETVLGITPTVPGFATLDIVPRLGRTLTWVSGHVPTPHGVVQAQFDLSAGTGEVTIPPGTVARIGVPMRERRLQALSINGRRVWGDQRHKRHKLARGIGAVIADLAEDTVYVTGVEPGRYTLSMQYAGQLPAAVQPPYVYPVRMLRQDDKTSGDWGSVYGQHGYVFFNYDGVSHDRRQLPGYVRDVTLTQGWASAHHEFIIEKTEDRRALASSPTNTGLRNVGYLTTGIWDPGSMAMAVDVHTTPNVGYQLALYVLDWQHAERRLAIELFDLETLKLVTPTKLVQHFEQGTYIVYACDRAVRIRIYHVTGADAVLVGLFFDPLSRSG